MAKIKVVEKDTVLVKEEKEKEPKKGIKGTRYSCTYSPKYSTTRKKAGTTYSPKY